MCNGYKKKIAHCCIQKVVGVEYQAGGTAKERDMQLSGPWLAETSKRIAGLRKQLRTIQVNLLLNFEYVLQFYNIWSPLIVLCLGRC